MQLGHGTARAVPAGDRDERGETLVEIMVAVVFMGLVVVSLLGGLFTLIKVADVNTQKTRSSVALQSYAEQIKQPVTAAVTGATYVPCAGTSSYGTFSGALPTGYTVEVTGVKHLSGYVVDGPFRKPQFGTTCTAATDLGLQQITVKVDTGDRAHRVRDTVVITKRNTTCPPNFSNADLGPC